MEDLVAAAAQALKFFFQGVDLPFCVQEGLGEGATAASLADEIDEVREPALLGVKLRLLEPERFRDVGIELPDLLFDAPEDVLDHFRGRKPRFEVVQDNLLDQRPADQ